MRQRFKCVRCGVRISGKLDPLTGLIYAYDRAPDGHLPERLMVCHGCTKGDPRVIESKGGVYAGETAGSGPGEVT